VFYWKGSVIRTYRRKIQGGGEKGTDSTVKKEGCRFARGRTEGYCVKGLGGGSEGRDFRRKMREPRRNVFF